MEVDIGPKNHQEQSYDKQSLSRQPLRCISTGQFDEDDCRKQNANDIANGGADDPEHKLDVGQHDSKRERDCNHAQGDYVEPVRRDVVGHNVGAGVGALNTDKS